MRFLSVLLLSFSACTNLFYYPEKEHALIPAELGIEYEDVLLDNGRLHGWFLPAQGPVKGNILHFHGNAQNISYHLKTVYWLPEKGFNVLLCDFSGYGLSKGSPSIEVVHEDALIFANYFKERSKGENIIVFGQSLGGAMALTLTPSLPFKPRLVVIEAAFSSYRKIFKEKVEEFWLLWPLAQGLSYLVNDSFSPIKVVDQISPIPILFVHSKLDDVVPYSHSETLFGAAKSPKEFLSFDAGGHLLDLSTNVEFLNRLEKAVQ